MHLSMGQTWRLFVYFCPTYNTTNTINGKSVDDVLGI